MNGVNMTIDEILEMWKIDSEVDITELANEAIKISKMHHKYYEIFIKEKLICKKYESDYKRLKLEKYEFYTQGPNEETIEKGWELPAKGLLLKSDIPMYMEADTDLINTSLKIGYQQEKVEMLESILKSLNSRGYNVKSAIDFIKFTSGA